MHAHRIGIERDLQPPFPIISPQPVADAQRCLELAIKKTASGVRSCVASS
jgi:hypothetical protein